jgi:hypothetical protein
VDLVVSLQMKTPFFDREVQSRQRRRRRAVWSDVRPDSCLIVHDRDHDRRCIGPS